MSFFRISFIILSLAYLSPKWGFAAEPCPSGLFKIECEFSGKHGSGDVDRLESKREMELLDGGLLETAREFGRIVESLEERGRNLNSIRYAGKMRELMNVMPDVRYVVHHSLEFDTDHYHGWSAEDDPEYEFPSKSLAGKGGIKVNITELTMRLLDLSNRMLSGEVGDNKYRGDEKLKEGFVNYFAVFIAHELLHVRQYQTGPATSYYNYWHMRCQELDCDDPEVRRKLADEMLQDKVSQGGEEVDLLASTKRKVEYEKDAYRLENAILNQEAAAYLAKAVADVAKDNPAFGEKGEFKTLMKKGGRTIFSSYAKGDYYDGWDTKRPFSGDERLYYNSQFAPMEVIRKLRALQAEIRDGDSSGEKVAQWRRRFNELESTWDHYVEDEEAQDNAESWVYLKPARSIYSEVHAQVKTALGASS